MKQKVYGISAALPSLNIIAARRLRSRDLRDFGLSIRSDMISAEISRIKREQDDAPINAGAGKVFKHRPGYYRPGLRDKTVRRGDIVLRPRPWATGWAGYAGANIHGPE